MIAQQQAENPGLDKPYGGDGDNSTIGGEGSSMQGTPRASVQPGATKLKLNFSAAAVNGNHMDRD